MKKIQLWEVLTEKFLIESSLFKRKLLHITFDTIEEASHSINININQD